FTREVAVEVVVSKVLEGGIARNEGGGSPLRVCKCLGYGIQMARGLAAAHDKSIASGGALARGSSLRGTRDGPAAATISGRSRRPSLAIMPPWKTRGVRCLYQAAPAASR